MGHTSLLYPPAPSCGTISFGTAIKAAVRHGYMGNPSAVVPENRIPLTAHLVFVYCVDEEVVHGCESHGDKFIPLLPPLSVTFLANLTISDDLVCYSASVFPTRSDTDPVLPGTFISGRTWVLCGSWTPEWVQRPLQIIHESKVHRQAEMLGWRGRPSCVISCLQISSLVKCPWICLLQSRWAVVPTV